MIIALLAALSASAAAGMRIALPLLLIGLLQGSDLWFSVPILKRIPPPVVIGVLVSWSLFEVFASKKLLGQRALQIIQLIFSPAVGAIMAMAIAVKLAALTGWNLLLLGLVGGLLALVLQLVQMGWFYRLRGLPTWAVFGLDGLCMLLVLLALNAPRQGGIIALLLLWLAIRSIKEWQHWYVAQANPADRNNPRRHKQDPD